MSSSVQGEGGSNLNMVAIQCFGVVRLPRTGASCIHSAGCNSERDRSHGSGDCPPSTSDLVPVNATPKSDTVHN